MIPLSLGGRPTGSEVNLSDAVPIRGRYGSPFSAVRAAGANRRSVTMPTVSLSVGPVPSDPVRPVRPSVRPSARPSRPVPSRTVWIVRLVPVLLHPPRPPSRPSVSRPSSPVRAISSRSSR